MRRMIKANIMGNAFDQSEKLAQLSSAASNYFGRAYSVTNGAPNEVQKVNQPPKSAKKTLTLVEGSRRPKVRAEKAVDGAGNTATVLGKRPRNQLGRRVGGAAAVKTFKCHLDSCGKIFNDRASLKKHMTVHGDKLVSSI